MIVEYENVKFHVNSKSSIELHLIKQAIKKKIGKYLGKPYIKDDYLEYAKKVLSGKKKAVIVDVGSNIGTTVLPLAKLFPDATFYAVEAHPIPGSRFIKNCELNKINNVNLISCAVGQDNKMAQIYTCPTNSGGHRLLGFSGLDVEKISTFGPILVPMVTLEKIFEQYNITHCDLLKIDTEGYECFIINFLGKYLNTKDIDCVVAEVGPEGLRKANCTPWQLVSIMKDKGFKCEMLDDKSKILAEKDLPLIPDFSVKDCIFYS